MNAKWVKYLAYTHTHVAARMPLSRPTHRADSPTVVGAIAGTASAARGSLARGNASTLPAYHLLLRKVRYRADLPY